MIELSSPQVAYDSDLTGGVGISADGQIVMVSGFVRRLDYPFYFAIDELLVQAGAGDAIEGWRNFSINGLANDGNTVWGQAVNPDGAIRRLYRKVPVGLFSDFGGSIARDNQCARRAKQPR